MPNTGFTIRHALERDCDSVYDLIAQLGYPGLKNERFRQVYRSILSQPGTIVLVADTDSVGLIGLESISVRAQLRLAGLLATIDELVVAEAARGMGVGRSFLREAIALTKHVAQKSNLPLRLQLETNRSRESYARGFYVKNGFREADSAIFRFAESVLVND